jgi:cobalt-zinc-cadmium efflux system outer membrane protein
MSRSNRREGGVLRRRFTPGLFGLLLVGASFVSLQAQAQAQAQEAGTPLIGTTVESVLNVAHRLSPTLRAAALDSVAASARADRADALADPMLSVQTMQVPGHRAPMDQTTVLLQQEFPLWGKLGLRKSAALAMLDAARGEQQATAAELDEKIKVAFANYYKASKALAINTDVARLDDEMARVATSRFGQGVGTQADALAAQADTTRTAVERLRLQRELTATTAQLNVRLGRSPNFPFAAPLSLRPLPLQIPTIDALLDRVQKENPVLQAQDARVRDAEAEQELARKNWYPDVTLGAGPQTNFGSWGVAASVGIRIPLQRGALESEEAEAGANLGAARERLAASTAEIQGDLAQALAALSAAEEMGAARRGQLVPQLNAAYKSVLAEYASGRGDLNPTLESVHRLHDTELELLDTDVEGQGALAMIERVIGGSL